MRTLITTLLICGALCMNAQDRANFLLRPVGAFSEANAKVLFDDMRSMTVRTLTCHYTAKSKEISVTSEGGLDMTHMLRSLEKKGWFIALAGPLPDGSPYPKDYILRSVRERWLTAHPELRSGTGPVIFMTQKEYDSIPQDKLNGAAASYEIIIE
ncbi:MAG: hypothetical protein MK081_12950 [Flavobacteriales bacterium]|nr:hypothetical protein [Flavobacteriales bacterium]